jgi:hypothetical protein
MCKFQSKFLKLNGSGHPQTPLAGCSCDSRVTCFSCMYHSITSSCATQWAIPFILEFIVPYLLNVPKRKAPQKAIKRQQTSLQKLQKKLSFYSLKKVNFKS